MESIAVIGTGISGMGAGYLLHDQYDITFYEKNDYPGGHTNTLTVDEDGEDIFIDSGFMVFNHKTYPNIIKLFAELDVEPVGTDMSFSFQHIPSGLEWKGTGFDNLFVQRKNIFNLRFIRMLLAVDKFGKSADEILDDERYASYTLGQYVKAQGINEDVLYHFMVPMSSAIWSCPPEKILDFPLVTLVRFFKNHGFIGLNTQSQWYTLKGGSRTYRDKILAHFQGKVRLNSAVVKISRQEHQVKVVDAGGNSELFDKVVVAAHADQALKMLDHPTDQQTYLLERMSYQPNRADLHTDSNVMPNIRKAWASWNYRLDEKDDGSLVPANVYYMNDLQKVSQKYDYFISIDDKGLIDRNAVIHSVDYEHPLFDMEAVRAQKHLPCLNDHGPIYFCGAYFRYGFHEDGFISAIDVARRIGGERVWS